MKNIINMFINHKKAESNVTAEEFIIKAAMEKAALYGGFESKNITVYKSVIADGLIELEFCPSDDTRCEMVYECYVDIITGEVLGYMGQAQKNWLENKKPCTAWSAPQSADNFMAIAA